MKNRSIKNLKVLAVAGLLCAMSVVFGKLLAVNVTEQIRISLENLPVILAGFAFGPFVGGAVGLVSDILGCLVKGYSILPQITVCAVIIGVLSGLVPFFFKKVQNRTLLIILTEAFTHVIGSMICKSYVLHLSYGTPWIGLLPRIPIYTVNIIIESLILIILYKNKTFARIMEEHKK